MAIRRLPELMKFSCTDLICKVQDGMKPRQLRYTRYTHMAKVNIVHSHNHPSMPHT